MQKRRASIPSKGLESIVQERIQKERNESKIRHGRGENPGGSPRGRKWEEGLKNENFLVPEREELPHEEKYDEKTRGPCLLYTSPSPRDGLLSRMPSSA